MNAYIYITSATTTINPTQAFAVPLGIAATGGILIGIVIALTVFFAGDPNGSRKSAISTTMLVSILGGATVGVLVVLLRDAGTDQPAPALMIQCVGVGILATILSSVFSLIIIRRLYVCYVGKADSSLEDAKRWASRSGRLRF
jgi:hypothetical protein